MNDGAATAGGAVPWVEYRTTNGHTVLIDLADWELLEPLLTAGVRLQSRYEKRKLRVSMTEYRPKVTMRLSKVLMCATAREVVIHLNGDPLDHRRKNLKRVECSGTPGWSSRIHGFQRPGGA